MNEVKNGRYVEEDGIFYYLNGEPHREDGPAKNYSNGDESWFLYGKEHREDGLAIIWEHYTAWWIDGKLHRLDCPAIEHSNGRKEWWISGVNFSEEEFNHWLSKKHLNEKLCSTLEERREEKGRRFKGTKWKKIRMEDTSLT